MSKKKIPIGERIRDARKSAGLTLIELGDRIGVCNSALSMIERGRRNPSRQTLVALSKELNTDFGEEYLSSPQKDSLFSVRDLERHGTTEERMADPFTEFDFEGVTANGTIVNRERGAVLIAVFGRVVKGQIIQAAPEDKCEGIKFPAEGFQMGRRAYALSVDDDSLRSAYLLPGDVLIYQEGGELTEGAAVVASLRGKVTIGRWSLRGSKVVLTPLDTAYRRATAASADVELLGMYVGMLRVVRRF